MIILKTDRLELREFSKDDMEDIVPRINDRSVYDNTLMIPHPYTEKDFMDYLKILAKSREDGRSLNLCMHLRSDDTAIGGLGLMNIDRNHGSADIGYWISSDMRRKGYTGEAVKALVRYGFYEIDLHRIQAVIFDHNTASGKLLESCGFKFEGIMRGRYLKDGRRIDGRIYSIIGTDPNI
jgi:RimJ/RimL family protein N-acetyltransferase